ncbi:hypothetical protein F8388_003057 [Cannabis sativa]|uniref:Uncharacterized protein n=1 Tax=Cannabis sativa TaxID=3483 RepID=A0A7J6HBF2_CANSA|nr:hypothetical protein F8388_003057 [Cannabis sativa]
MHYLKPTSTTLLVTSITAPLTIWSLTPIFIKLELVIPQGNFGLLLFQVLVRMFPTFLALLVTILKSYI